VLISVASTTSVIAVLNSSSVSVKPSCAHDLLPYE
jgi:hypothetical protein